MKLYDGATELPVQWTGEGTTVWKPGNIPARGYHVFTAIEAEETAEAGTASISVNLEDRTLETRMGRDSKRVLGKHRDRLV